MQTVPQINLTLLPRLPFPEAGLPHEHGKPYTQRQAHLPFPEAGVPAVKGMPRYDVQESIRSVANSLASTTASFSSTRSATPASSRATTPRKHLFNSQSNALGAKDPVRRDLRSQIDPWAANASKPRATRTPPRHGGDRVADFAGLASEQLASMPSFIDYSDDPYQHPLLSRGFAPSVAAH